jgi:hypothetical protein
MHALHPDIAARWDKEYPDQRGLPEKVKLKRGKIKGVKKTVKKGKANGR